MNQFLFYSAKNQFIVVIIISAIGNYEKSAFPQEMTICKIQEVQKHRKCKTFFSLILCLHKFTFANKFSFDINLLGLSWGELTALQLQKKMDQKIDLNMEMCALKEAYHQLPAL